MGTSRAVSHPREGRRSGIQTPAERPDWNGQGEAQGRTHHLLGGQDRCNLSFTNNVEAAHYFGTLSPTPSSFWSKTE